MASARSSCKILHTVFSLWSLQDLLIKLRKRSSCQDLSCRHTPANVLAAQSTTPATRSNHVASLAPVTLHRPSAGRGVSDFVPDPNKNPPWSRENKNWVIMYTIVYISCWDALILIWAECPEKRCPKFEVLHQAAKQRSNMQQPGN